ALGGAARGIADARRVVADDEHPGVPLVLERAHALERDRAPDVDVRRGDVDPELDPERTAERKLALELVFREDVDGVPGELGDAHRKPTIAVQSGSSVRPSGRTEGTPAEDPEAAPAGAARHPPPARHGVVRVRARHGARRRDPDARPSPLPP